MNLNKALVIVYAINILCACNEPTEPYENAKGVANSYFNYDSIKEGELILFYSKNSGCVSCRDLVKDALDSLQFNPNIYIVTNSKSSAIKSNRIVYDSLGLMNTNDLGFVGPTFLIKKGNNLHYLLEVNANNKDSFNLLLSKYL